MPVLTRVSSNLSMLLFTALTDPFQCLTLYTYLLRVHWSVLLAALQPEDVDHRKR